MGIEIQLLSSIEGLPSCKIGGAFNADIGKWLRLVRDGEAFAQTCVYEDWNISLTQTSGLSFYQVESSQDGKSYSPCSLTRAQRCIFSIPAAPA